MSRGPTTSPSFIVKDKCFGAIHLPMLLARENDENQSDTFLPFLGRHDGEDDGYVLHSPLDSIMDAEVPRFLAREH